MLADRRPELAIIDWIPARLKVLCKSFPLDELHGEAGTTVLLEPQPVDRDDPRVLELPADLVTDQALQWLSGRRSAAPFFLWVHYQDPHGPYDPPAPRREAPGQKMP